MTFGFTISGGDDIDGLPCRVDSIDPYGAAAEGGLHVGDRIVSINGQVRACGVVFLCLCVMCFMCV